MQSFRVFYMIRSMFFNTYSLTFNKSTRKNTFKTKILRLQFLSLILIYVMLMLSESESRLEFIRKKPSLNFNLDNLLQNETSKVDISRVSNLQILCEQSEMNKLNNYLLFKQYLYKPLVLFLFYYYFIRNQSRTVLITFFATFESERNHTVLYLC